MRILIAATDLFSFTGGGQSFFRKYIESSEHDFYCFASDKDSLGSKPANVREIKITDVYRKNFSRFNFTGILTPGSGKPLEAVKYDILYILDLAASVEGMHFDIVEIPDYFVFGALLPNALRYHGVQFDKIVASLHGVLSDALLQNWGNLKAGDFELLRLYEEKLYLTSDVRYGISHAYLSEWERRTGYAGELIDIRAFLNSDEFFDRSVAGSPNKIAPTMTFIGRQEKWKGPDIFIDICSRLPRSSYSSIRVLGNDVNVDGIHSRSVLERMASIRGLKVEFDCLSRSELIKTLQSHRQVAFMPSRHDTFNLAALEATLSGCPVVLSNNCGIVHFLDTVAPGCPHIRLDPENIGPAVNELVKRIEHFDLWLEECRSYADKLAHVKADSVRYGATQVEIWSTNPKHDYIVRQQLDDIFDNITRSLTSAAFGVVWDSARSELEQRLDAMFAGIDAGPSKQFLLEIFDASCQLGRDLDARQKVKYVGEVIADDTAVSSYARYSHSGDRASAWRSLADIELKRGNDLLYATYQIRYARLSGAALPNSSSVAEILKRHNYATEAAFIQSLYGHGASSTVDRYLVEQRRHDISAQSILSEIIERRSMNARISIIVSVYNGASKIGIFISQFISVPKDILKSIEIIFVDANSQDETRATIAKQMSEFEVDYVYVRCAIRETIQAAWNRGLVFAMGEYVAFLGLDEANRADAFSIMMDYLDTHPVVDWVQGNAVIVDVNASGSYIGDVMPYKREFIEKTDHYLDSCYIGFVGSLIRRRVFEKVGYFDERFRGAGDTEFKNRALPHLHFVTLPETLGFFLNFQEERMTLSPLAEIEDIRAWYLYRSVDALHYAFRETAPGAIVDLFMRSLQYSKTYFSGNCTDIELALNIGQFLKERAGWRSYYNQICRFLPHLETLLGAYRALDTLTLNARTTPVPSIYDRSGMIESAAYAIVTSVKSIRFLGCKDFRATFTNDNRSHQHIALWPSKVSTFGFDKSSLQGALSWSDLAGSLDLSEVLSSANSDDANVDITLAWQHDTLSQVKRLHIDASFAVFCPPSSCRADREKLEAELRARPLEGVRLLIGWRPTQIDQLPASYSYVDEFETIRPLYAGSEIILIPADRQTARGVLSSFLQTILFCKPLVASGPLLELASTLFPEIDFSPLELFKTPTEALQAVARLLEDRDGIDLNRQCVTYVAAQLSPLLGVSIERDSLVHFGPKVALANRLFRKAFEMNERISPDNIEAYFQIGERECLSALWRSLLVTKDAPILKTRHSFFRRLAFSVPWTDSELSVFIDELLEGSRSKIYDESTSS